MGCSRGLASSIDSTASCHIARDVSAGLVSGNRFMLSKAITFAESTRADHRRLGAEILDRALRARADIAAREAAQTLRVGISGPPGLPPADLHFRPACARFLRPIGRRQVIVHPRHVLPWYGCSEVTGFLAPVCMCSRRCQAIEPPDAVCSSSFVLTGNVRGRVRSTCMPPGVGKSTFIEALGIHLIEHHGVRVAVVGECAALPRRAHGKTRRLSWVAHHAHVCSPMPSCTLREKVGA